MKLWRSHFSKEFYLISLILYCSYSALQRYITDSMDIKIANVNILGTFLNSLNSMAEPLAFLLFGEAAFQIPINLRMFRFIILQS